MNKKLYSLLLGALVLAACTPKGGQMNHSTGGMNMGGMNMDNGTATSEGMMAGDHAMKMQPGTQQLTVQKEQGSSPTDLAFSIRKDGQVFTDFGISHTKKMHFILVRDDLQYFSHVHPTMDVRGIWHETFTPEAGGNYWLYADFVDSADGSYSPRYGQSFTADKGQYGLVKDFTTEKTVDGYHITMQPTVAGTSATFAYTITDGAGNPVELEDYLGAKGHSILLTTKGDFTHAHAESVPPVFATEVAGNTFYRMYTQFQIKGKVITVPFDWQS